MEKSVTQRAMHPWQKRWSQQSSWPRPAALSRASSSVLVAQIGQSSASAWRLTGRPLLAGDGTAGEKKGEEVRLMMAGDGCARGEERGAGGPP